MTAMQHLTNSSYAALLALLASLGGPVVLPHPLSAQDRRDEQFYYPGDFNWSFLSQYPEAARLTAMSGAETPSLKFGIFTPLPNPGLFGASWYWPPEPLCQPWPDW